MYEKCLENPTNIYKEEKIRSVFKPNNYMSLNGVRYFLTNRLNKKRSTLLSVKETYH